jgi:hypothetical protein
LFGRVWVELRGGGVDDLWASSYLQVRHEAEQFSRFHLDAQLGRVSFTFRSSGTADEIQDALGRLTLLLELANLQATTAAATAKIEDRRRA